MNRNVIVRSRTPAAEHALEVRGSSRENDQPLGIAAVAFRPTVLGNFIREPIDPLALMKKLCFLHLIKVSADLVKMIPKPLLLRANGFSSLAGPVRLGLSERSAFGLC